MQAQILADRESKMKMKETTRKEELDMLSQIKESLQMAQKKRRNLIYEKRKHLDEENMVNVREKSRKRKVQS